MSSEPLLHRLGQLNWPTPLSDHPDPAPGQLWRASWGDIAALVVVLGAAKHRTVQAAAASADRTGDDGTILASTTSGMAPAVWTTITAEIKTFTLEHRVTDLTPESLDTVLAVTRGDAPGGWAPIVDDVDDRALVRGDLADRVRELAAAEWVPENASGAPTLEELAARAGITASQLARTLGITPGDARRLVRGHRQPTPIELPALTALLGAAPAPSAAFDEALVASMDTPEFRRSLQLVAAKDHFHDEAAARRAYAGQMMAVAARHREKGSRNWKALIRDSLHED